MITKKQVQFYINEGCETGIIKEGKFKGAKYIKKDNNRWLICAITGDGYEKYLLPLKMDNNKIMWVCKKSYYDKKKENIEEELITKNSKALELVIKIITNIEDSYVKSLKEKIKNNPNINDNIEIIIENTINEVDMEFDRRIESIDSREFIKNIIEKIF